MTGAVLTGDAADILTLNSGSTWTSGTASDTGAGVDTFINKAGAAFTGMLKMGDGEDEANIAMGSIFTGQLDMVGDVDLVNL